MGHWFHTISLLHFFTNANNVLFTFKLNNYVY